jgi:hypothetical protein
MDIMNNMTVSSSKFTFSLIAITALLVLGTGMSVQQTFAATNGGGPTFIAIHNSTTTTEIIFSEGVNGTASIFDWTINGVNATAITNGTTPSAANIAASNSLGGKGGGAVGSGSETFGFFNRTLTIMLTHQTLNTGDTMVVNYTGNNSEGAGDGDLRNSLLFRTSDDFQLMDYFNGTAIYESEHTALDGVAPVQVSAAMVDSKRVRITMSEGIGNYNTTAHDFSLHGPHTGGITFESIVANNGTGGTSATSDGDLIYLTTNKPIPKIAGPMTISYGAPGALYALDDQSTAAQILLQVASLNHWLTDDTHSYNIGCRTSCDEAPTMWATNGVGNRLANFTGLALPNTIVSDDTSSVSIDNAPEVVASSVQVNSQRAQALVGSSPVNVDVEVGDTVTFDFSISDDNGSFYIPYVALYTNFIDRPDDMNLFYTNNFDSVTQESASYYEWNVRSDDVSYDYSSTMSWNEASYTIVDAETIDIQFSMEITNTMNPSEVWLQVGDTTYNFNNQQLPLTLDVTGDELLSFESDNNQKLLGFLNESVLSTMVSGWNTSNDDLANVEQFSSALGVDDQVLPAWTTNLANWVVVDDIEVAEMIVAVEYIINQ